MKVNDQKSYFKSIFQKNEEQESTNTKYEGNSSFAAFVAEILGICILCIGLFVIPLTLPIKAGGLWLIFDLRFSIIRFLNRKDFHCYDQLYITENEIVCCSMRDQDLWSIERSKCQIYKYNVFWGSFYIFSEISLDGMPRKYVRIKIHKKAVYCFPANKQMEKAYPDLFNCPTQKYIVK